MNATRILSALIGILGLVQIVVGVPLWMGHAKSLTGLHMILGIVFVAAMWVMCVIGFRARMGGLSALTLVWSFVVVGLGMAQMQLLPGPGHWVIRVAHLLVGLIALALAGRIGAGARRRSAASPQSVPRAV